MKTTTRVTCDIDGLALGWWDEEKENFIPVKSQNDVEKAALVLGCSEKMVDTLGMLVESIKESVGGDLRDIWKRLDEAGI